MTSSGSTIDKRSLGSTINLDATPDTVTLDLTPQLTVTCKLSADAAATDVPDVSDEFCDITSTTEEIECVTSIVISREDTGQKTGY